MQYFGQQEEPCVFWFRYTKGVPDVMMVETFEKAHELVNNYKFLGWRGDGKRGKTPVPCFTDDDDVSDELLKLMTQNMRLTPPVVCESK